MKTVSKKLKAMKARMDARCVEAAAYLRTGVPGKGAKIASASVPAAAAILMAPQVACAATSLDSIVKKWTGMFTDVQSSIVKLLAAAAVVAILILLLLGLFSNDPMERKRLASAIVTILVICAVAAVAVSLVNWGFGKDVVKSSSSYIS